MKGRDWYNGITDGSAIVSSGLIILYGALNTASILN